LFYCWVMATLSGSQPCLRNGWLILLKVCAEFFIRWTRVRDHFKTGITMAHGCEYRRNPRIF
jgi:hypothetical protein